MLNRPCSSLADVLKVPRFVSFVLSSLCVAPNFVDVRICQQISPNKAIWNNGMIWGKTAVVCAFNFEEENIQQESILESCKKTKPNMV